MMEKYQQEEKNIPPSSVRTRAGLAKRLAGFVLAVSMVLFFMFYLGPLMQDNPYFRPIVRFIDERGIDASALYYTEIEEFSEADITMNNTMDYMPHKD